MIAILIYEIRITDNAKEDYSGFDARWKATIKSAIQTHLRNQPEKQSKSRIKRLRSLRRPQFRLRIGDLRVFYDVGNDFVEVLAIVTKQNAANWLAEHGIPEDD